MEKSFHQQLHNKQTVNATVPLRHTSAVGIPASCSLIIPIIWASVKRLCRICLLLQRLSKLYIKVMEISGGRSGTDLADISQTWLNDVAALMNNRPRKTLGWRTPAEAMTDETAAFRPTVALDV
jgi:hypothetical protein